MSFSSSRNLRIAAVLVAFFGPTLASAQTLETRTASSPNLCNDTIDNDGNGYIDANDPSCQSEVLCQDGYDNDGDGPFDGSDSDCLCMGSFGAGSCTANDISISYTAQPLVSDGCVNSNDTVTAQLTATITNGQPSRYDMGMWLSLSGGAGNAVGPLCVRQALIPVPTTDLFLNGPYQNLDADRCGDGSNGIVQTYHWPFPTTVPCTDLFTPSGGSAGWVDLGQCGSWNQPGGNTVCNNPGTIDPGTGSKCRCGRGDTAIPGPNLRSNCSNFNTPSGLGANSQLDVGETATFQLGYTNTVANCAPGAPVGSDVYGRVRCGTASFVRFVINYPAVANTYGTWTYFNNVANTNPAIPSCPAAVDVPFTPAPNLGYLCNDVTNHRLIWAPRDSNTANSPAVISAFTGSRSLTFRYTLNSDPGVTVTSIPISSQIYWDDQLETPASPATPPISASEAVDLTGAVAQTCTDCSCGANVSTTPVSLASFTASGSSGNVRFDWSTATEVGNVGFNLYALVKGQRVRLNDEPIAAIATDSLEPQSYSATLRVPEGATSFEIVDLDVRGSERRHGPFEAVKRYGRPLESEPILWQAIRRENGVLDRNGGHAAERATKPGKPPLYSLDLRVNQTGLHRVSYEALLAAGFDFSTIESSSIGVFSPAGAVPIFVSAGRKFGPGSYLEFYGEALDTIYTTTNIYRLKSGLSAPARATVIRDRPSGAATASFTETRTFERDREYSVSAPLDDPFYDTRMLVFSNPGAWDFPFQVDGLLSGAAGAIEVDLWGGADVPNVAPDHRVVVEVNGVAVGTAEIDGVRGRAFRAPIPAGVLVAGANALTLRLPGVPGTPYDLTYLDRFSVSYPRQFEAAQNRLDFTASGPKLTVSGLTSSNIAAYRIGSGSLARFERVDVSLTGGGRFQASIAGTTVAQKYAVVGEGGMLTPASIVRTRSGGDVLAGSYDLLVIAHTSFVSSLSAFTAARQAAGLSVKVVDVEDLYAAYSGGVLDAAAIQAAIGVAASRGARYVLLVGGDSYDYRNRLNLGSVSFIPTIYAQSGPVVFHAPADSLLADRDGDGLQDLAIGRWPVRSADELAAVIAKTLEYDARGYFGTAALAADHSDSATNQPFAFASDEFANGLPGDWEVAKIYLDEQDLTLARANLLGAFGIGTGLISYVGHSGFTSWGSPSVPVSQHLFTTTDANALTNSGAPSVVAQFGCWNTYFSSPRTDSLGMRLVLGADRGAAAVLGAATLTQDINSAEFGEVLARTLGQPGMTLGEGIRLAKDEWLSTTASERDVRDLLFGWTLLGDPTLVVQP